MYRRKPFLAILIIMSLMLMWPPAVLPLAPRDQEPGATTEAPRAPTAAARLEGLGVLSQLGGDSYGAAVVEDVAYVGIGPRLVILDIEDPAAPVLLGQTEPLGGVVQSVAVAGTTAYVAAGDSGLYILDVTDPANPAPIGPGYDTSGFSQGVSVVGSYACIADSLAGLVVLDVSNPNVPQLYYSFNTPGYALAVHADGEPANSFAYVADGDGGVHLFRLTPAPGLESTYTEPGIFAEDVVVLDDVAYVANGGGGLLVIDVVDHDLPAFLASLPMAGYAEGLDVENTTVYVALSDAGLSVVDVTAPDSPSEVGFTDTPGLAFDAVAACPAALVADGSGGVRIVDVTAPTAPAEVAFYNPPSSVEGVAAAQAVVYTAEGDGGLGVVDVSNPALPAEAGALDSPGYALGDAVSGTLTYLADGWEGLRLIDVASPAGPAEVGAFVPDPADPASFEAVALRHGYAFVADSLAGMRVVDVSNPALPAQVALYVPLGPALDVAVDEFELAYVAAGNEGLHLADVFDPLNPFEIAIIDTPGYAQGVARYGDYAYVADGSGGLRILDITDPAGSQEVGAYPTLSAEAVATMGSYYAFLADGADGLRVLDITDPAAPTQIAALDTPGLAVDVAAYGGYIYVADLDGGLWLLQLGETDDAVSKTDGLDQVPAGDTITYTVVVSNAGPYAVAGVQVVDRLPAGLLDASWLCDATPGSACPEGSGLGDVDTAVDLLPDGRVVFSVTGMVDWSATHLTNTVTASVPPGVVDADLTNNTAADVDEVLLTVDLAVAKSDGQATAVAGAPLTYTVEVYNAGPAPAEDAAVTDLVPDSLSDVTWSCQAAAGATCDDTSGSGDIDTTVDLPAGGVVTFTLHGTLDPAATGALTNTATVEPPAGVTEIDPDDNSDADVDAVEAVADLAVTKSDGVEGVTPGTALTYTIVVGNGGPSAVQDAAVADPFPAAFLDAAWTCQAGTGAACDQPAGTGDVDTTVDLAPGSVVTFTASGLVDAEASGLLANTATVEPPAGTDDPDDGNNTATDTDVVTSTADLSLLKTASPDPVTAGTPLTYTLAVLNSGPSTADGVVLVDDLPAGVSLSWASPGCDADGGTVTCTVGTLLSGESATVTLVVLPEATGWITNTATVWALTFDPIPASNQATAVSWVEPAEHKFTVYLPIVSKDRQ